MSVSQTITPPPQQSGAELYRVYASFWYQGELYYESTYILNNFFYATLSLYQTPTYSKTIQLFSLLLEQTSGSFGMSWESLDEETGLLSTVFTVETSKYHYHYVAVDLNEFKTVQNRTSAQLSTFADVVVIPYEESKTFVTATMNLTKVEMASFDRLNVNSSLNWWDLSFLEASFNGFGDSTQQRLLVCGTSLYGTDPYLYSISADTFTQLEQVKVDCYSGSFVAPLFYSSYTISGRTYISVLNVSNPLSDGPKVTYLTDSIIAYSTLSDGNYLFIFGGFANNATSTILQVDLTQSPPVIISQLSYSQNTNYGPKNFNYANTSIDRNSKRIAISSDIVQVISYE